MKHSTLLMMASYCSRAPSPGALVPHGRPTPEEQGCFQRAVAFTWLSSRRVEAQQHIRLNVLILRGLTGEWPPVDPEEKRDEVRHGRPGDWRRCLDVVAFETSCFGREKVPATLSTCTLSNTLGCGNFRRGKLNGGGEGGCACVCVRL